MKKLYYAIVGLLALISVSLAGLDIAGLISINKEPFFLIDRLILLFFWVDYIVRFTQSKNKWQFFKSNIFDFLAIIPFDSFFTLFRISRAIKVLKLLRFVRIIGFSVQFKKNVDKFINTNGFIYLMTFAMILILISAGIYSLAENTSYGNALWWAIVTVTTVGYGDIAPKTDLGRGIAIILMFVGIGLIGTITSTVTSFFTQQQEDKTIDELRNRLNKIDKKLDEIDKKK